MSLQFLIKAGRIRLFVHFVCFWVQHRSGCCRHRDHGPQVKLYRVGFGPVQCLVVMLRLVINSDLSLPILISFRNSTGSSPPCGNSELRKKIWNWSSGQCLFSHVESRPLPRQSPALGPIINNSLSCMNNSDMSAISCAVICKNLMGDCKQLEATDKSRSELARAW